MPNPIAPEKIAALRFHRQKLAEPVQTEQEYRELFRMLSPVMTPYWCCPGDPPSISPRAAFDEKLLCNRLRLEHKLIKGRFQKGRLYFRGRAAVVRGGGPEGYPPYRAGAGDFGAVPAGGSPHSSKNQGTDRNAGQGDYPGSP